MNGKEVLQAVDNWAIVFRLVTPALLGVLVWSNTAGNASRDKQLDYIITRLDLLSSRVDAIMNNHLHALGNLKERIGKLEGRAATEDTLKK